MGLKRRVTLSGVSISLSNTATLTCISAAVLPDRTGHSPLWPLFIASSQRTQINTHMRTHTHTLCHACSKVMPVPRSCLFQGHAGSKKLRGSLLPVSTFCPHIPDNHFRYGSLQPHWDTHFSAVPSLCSPSAQDLVISCPECHGLPKLFSLPSGSVHPHLNPFFLPTTLVQMYLTHPFLMDF